MFLKTLCVPKRVSFSSPVGGGWEGASKTLLIMKLTAILILAAVMQVSATGYGQTISLNVKDAPIEKVFREIKAQTGYSFVYAKDLSEKAKKITIELKAVSIEDALSAVFKDQPFTYSIVNTVVIVNTKDEKTPLVQSEEKPSALPPVDIHGRVVDSAGAPLIGANVLVKGTNKGTSTDGNGYFELKGIDDNVTVVITFTGYSEKEYRISGQSFFSIVLKRSESQLDEVQIIAYGTQTKRYSVNNVTTIKGEDIANQPVGSALLALQGRAPGLFISPINNFIPGSSVSVKIQGQNSILRGGFPLYIIDGVPYPTQTLPTTLDGILGGTSTNPGNERGSGDPLSYINLSDIESVSVLTDADATSIYGSRAANGAIIITTKKAKAGPTKMNVDVQQGWGKIPRMLN